MFNLVGMTAKMAEEELKKHNLCYKVIRYNSRFKEDIQTDSFRVVRQRLNNDGSVELIVSDFKTITQGQ